MGGTFEPDIVFRRGDNRGAIRTGADSEPDFFEADDLARLYGGGCLVFELLSSREHVAAQTQACWPWHRYAAMACNHASSAIDIRGADHGSALIDPGIGNDGKEVKEKGVTLPSHSA